MIDINKLHSTSRYKIYYGGGLPCIVTQGDILNWPEDDADKKCVTDRLAALIATDPNDKWMARPDKASPALGLSQDEFNFAVHTPFETLDDDALLGEPKADLAEQLAVFEDAKAILRADGRKLCAIGRGDLGQRLSAAISDGVENIDPERIAALIGHIGAELAAHGCR